jgi:hypothetical protein
LEAAKAADQQSPAIIPAEASAQVFSSNLVNRPGERDSPEDSTSWVRIAFLTWGGLLTLGSALRLLIG